jgi:hypothetical protein
VVAAWSERLRTAEELLAEGKYKRARSLAHGVIEDVGDRVHGGEGVGPFLAGAVLLRAVAEGGLGDEEAAVWDWYAAVALDPSIRERDLSRYGPAVASIERERDSPLEPPSGQPSVELTPPQRNGHGPIQYPRGLLIACVEGVTTLSTVIGLDGRPRAPHWVGGLESPLLAFFSMEGLRHWRFRPAQEGDRPVVVIYLLTVNFDRPLCDNLYVRKERAERE